MMVFKLVVNTFTSQKPHSVQVALARRELGVEGGLWGEELSFLFVLFPPGLRT